MRFEHAAILRAEDGGISDLDGILPSYVQVEVPNRISETTPY
jgi:hypothetical protein